MNVHARFVKGRALVGDVVPLALRDRFAGRDVQRGDGAVGSSGGNAVAGVHDAAVFTFCVDD